MLEAAAHAPTVPGRLLHSVTVAGELCEVSTWMRIRLRPHHDSGLCPSVVYRVNSMSQRSCSGFMLTKQVHVMYCAGWRLQEQQGELLETYVDGAGVVCGKAFKPPGKR